jgi:hypothetical protein
MPIVVVNALEAAIREVEEALPQVRGLLEKQEGAALLVQQLPQAFARSSMREGDPAVRAWNIIGWIYFQQERFPEALSIHLALYDAMLAFQERANTRCHKGMPLIWASDCYRALGYGLTSRRFLMLTLVEDAIRENGVISPEKTGAYFRLVWSGRLSDGELKRYAQRIDELNKRHALEARFPEWVLQKLDNEWMTQAPDFREAGQFVANTRYIQHLIGQLGEGSCKVLERLARYLVSSMPGCRTLGRVRTPSTDYDVVCSAEGVELDFRSEFGRYFVCECKDKRTPADYSTVAKFCRVLDSVKSRFGILFSTKGISGEGNRRDADLERLKVFQDRGTVIVVVDRHDLERLANGANFISILRTKYERVRLDWTG